jgi:Holliday junction resolvasome RuvABC DNA-binding subunit
VQQLIEQGDTNMQIKLKIPEVNPKTVDRWVRDFRQSVDRAATAKRKRQEQDDAVVPKITKVYSVEKQECFNYLSQGFSLDQIQELIRTASKRKLFTWEWLYHKKTLNSENSSESD